MSITSLPPSRETASRRVGPLAMLPVFLKLDGRRAVVAGGGDAAAWKAELMAAAGAEVHVFAEGPGTQMDALLAQGNGSGRYVHHARRWDGTVFADAAVAICDARDDQEARAFHAAAVEAGVPVNVIDRPDWCSFQFGAIVNRSPVVVAISTDGAAPILGQAIRRRIETLLPPSVADWARLARGIRVAVAGRLAPGRQRRAFWERFVERCFGPSPTPETASDLLSEAGDIASGMEVSRGRVTLVGAGPGDAELLTLKAVRALQSADVILFDDLVSGAVLDLARREARRMLVGYGGGHGEDSDGIMVKLARAGKHVVRLTGGGPILSDHGDNAIARLDAENIPVSVVPGITSAPARHSDVRFATGQAEEPPHGRPSASLSGDARRTGPLPEGS